MSVSKIFFSILGAIAIILVMLALRPIYNVGEEDCSSIDGTVVAIFEGGTKDVVFRLEGDDRRFYINRGLENGLDMKELEATVLNSAVTLKYVNHWTPLDPKNKIRHLAELEYEGEVLYSEIQ